MKSKQPIPLSAVFPAAEVARDAAVGLTFGPRSSRPGTACYAAEAPALEIANSNPQVVAIITTAELAEKVAAGKGCVIHAQPQRAFYKLHNQLFAEGVLDLHDDSAIHPTARVATTAVIGRHVVLGANVVVDHGAILEDFTIVGEDTYIGPNAVIGMRGLYNSYIDGANVFIHAAGAVRIGKRCELLSGATVAKSYLSEFTEIDDDVKIGGRASVGHGCNVGAGTIVGANTVLAGNVKVGKKVWTGPNVAIADGLSLGDQARVLIGSVVINHVPAGESVSGNFALSHPLHLRQFIRQRYER